MRRVSPILAAAFLVSLVSFSPLVQQVEGQQAKKPGEREMMAVVIEQLVDARDDVQTRLDKTNAEYAAFRRENIKYVIYDADTLRHRLLQTEERQEATTEEIAELESRLALLKERSVRFEDQRSTLLEGIREQFSWNTKQDHFAREVERQTMLLEEISQKLSEADLIQTYGE